MAKYDGVLFDLDGTLLDTTQGVVHAVELTHIELGISVPSHEVLKRFVGPPMQDSFIREYGFSAEEAQNAANIFRTNYVKHSLIMAEIYPGVIEVLSFLKERGYKVGVATYKREDYAIDILKYFGIAEYCDVIHGADNNNVLKKEDIVNMCLDELEIRDRNKIILIGDSEYDAVGAEKAGVNFFGVTYGFGFKCGTYTEEYNAIGWSNELIKFLDYL